MSFAPETRRRDPLERTTLRLAGVFAIVIVLLLVSSSVLLYTSFTRDIHDVYDRAVHDEAREREMVADAISRLRVQVIATDAVVFIVVGAAGLWYARRTVQPIREALENQRRFIANASHELRTPLAIVKADLEVARRGPPDAAALSAAVDSSLEEVDRMSALVSDLLTLSRIDAREERLAREALDLSSLVDATVQKLEAYAGERRVAIVREGGRDALPTVADPDALQRALFNLVRNAVEHSPAGERVAVRLMSDGDQARIQIADRGAGMTRDQLDRVFERFYRSTPGGSGSGLGLPIARWIVEAHGGSLTLVSGADGGTTATLLLPLGRPSVRR